MLHRIAAVASLLLVANCCLAQAPGKVEEGFIKIFNGKDLKGWRGDAHWSVEDGAITGKTTPETLLKYNTFLIWEGGQPANFELRCSYKIVGGNSGVQYRSRIIDEDKFVVSGYQADIDSSPKNSGINYEEKARKILALRGERTTIAADGTKSVEKIGDPETLQKQIKSEDWNDYVVIAKGNRLQHVINGTLMSEVIDNQSDKAAKLGVLALQVHQGPPMTVQFKNLRIKQLK